MFVNFDHGLPLASVEELTPNRPENLDWKAVRERNQKSATQTQEQSLVGALGEIKSVDSQLFDTRALAKRMTSQIAMYLSQDFRDQLFSQIDALFDIDNWEPGDRLLEEASYRTFLRALLALNINMRPGLGLSDDGNLLAIWKLPNGRISMEFLKSDRVRWFVSSVAGKETDTAAGETSVVRLHVALAAYDVLDQIALG